MPGNPLVRFDEGRVGRTARCRLLSYSTERLFLKPVDDSSDALFDQCDIEVDPQAFVSQFQVGEKLLFVDRCDHLARLDLDDYLILHYEVRVKPGVNSDGLVDDGNGLFT